jgi:uncharacterized protein (DUF885 family)
VTEIFGIADSYVEALCRLDPFTASAIGEPGYDDQVTDYSPDGVDARIDLARATLRTLDAATPENDPDRIAAAVLRDRIEVMLESHEAGNPWRQLSNFDSPITFIRSAFDLAPRATPEDWAHIATRMSQVPDAISGFMASLRHGLATNQIAPRRQALVCARQAGTLGGENASGHPYFEALAAAGATAGADAEALRAGARLATGAYAELAKFLKDDYAPLSRESDAAGEEVYALGVRRFLGLTCDLREVYEWGWEELHRLEAEMDRTADVIAPGLGLDGAIALLREDPTRGLETIEELLGFLQGITDRTIDELNGVHFDIPKEIRRVECRQAPPGTAAAMYYTPPSADFSRPGRTWYPVRERSRFPLWTEVSTAYHEGVPGHHLQVGLCMTFQDRLSRFQRELGFYSGHGEGWALYAERLMEELGYLENPDYRLGMLAAHAFRSMRVIVDIGLHLRLQIPDSEHYQPGKVWDWEVALPFVTRYSYFGGPGFALSELERYCGLPAQAISYKVGERVWLDVRSQLRERLGSAFDLKRFHMDALHMGSLPLDQLRREMLQPS